MRVLMRPERCRASPGPKQHPDTRTRSVGENTNEMGKAICIHTHTHTHMYIQMISRSLFSHSTPRRCHERRGIPALPAGQRGFRRGGGVLLLPFQPVFVCLCVCVYVFACTCLYVCIYTYVCIFILMCVCTFVCVCMSNMNTASWQMYTCHEDAYMLHM